MDRALPGDSGEDERIVLNLLTSVDDGAVIIATFLTN